MSTVPPFFLYRDYLPLPSLLAGGDSGELGMWAEATSGSQAGGYSSLDPCLPSSLPSLYLDTILGFLDRMHGVGRNPMNTGQLCSA